MRRVVLAAALIGTSGCVGGGGPPIPLNPVRFLSINDVYVADTMADGEGGLARVATVRRRLADQGPVIFVLAGDLLSPSLLSKYYNGRQMVEALDSARLDYATFGNHEFELPVDTLDARIAASTFKWISSNCTLADGKPFPKVLPWDTVRVSGHKVGLFGLTLQGPYRKQVRCSNPDSAAHLAIDTLAALGADLIVGLTHQTIESRPRPAHQGAEARSHPGRARARGTRLGRLGPPRAQGRRQLAHGPVRHALGRKGAMEGGSRPGPHRLPASRRQPGRAGGEGVGGFPAAAARARSACLARTTVPIDARDVIGRSQESVLGDLVTDAMRAGTRTDVAMLNAGTLRLDDVIKPGPITNYQLESIFLFSDETRVISFRLTGARLREILEHGVADGSLGKGPFLQVSGLRFTYDPTAPSGSRIVGDVTRARVRPFGPTDTLAVAFPVYPACDGGDGYDVPEAKAGCDARGSAPRAVDLLSKYISDSLAGTIGTPEDGRIKRAANTNPG